MILTFSILFFPVCNGWWWWWWWSYDVMASQSV